MLTPKVTPLLSRKVGHVPFKSFLTKDDKKGKFMLTTKFNGQEYVGVGETERQAALDLQKILDKATSEDKLIHTRVHD